MKAIELSGLHIGKWVKVSFKTNRKNGKQHEWWVFVAGVRHDRNGNIDLADYTKTSYYRKNWHPSPERMLEAEARRVKNGGYQHLSWGVEENAHPILPYYADVEVLDLDNYPSA